MSRQIYFYHSKTDATAFWNAAEKLGARVLMDGEILSLSQARGEMLSWMDSHMHPFYLIPENETVSTNQTRPSAWDGNVVEYVNSYKGTPNSQTYNVGRIYICALSSGDYHDETAKLYNGLVKYIKKNYTFVRKKSVYCAPDFLEKYRSKLCKAAWLNMPIEFL